MSSDDKKLARLPGSTLDPHIQVVLFEWKTPEPSSSSSTSINPTKRSASLRRQNKPSTIIISNEKENDQDDNEIYSPWSG